MDYLKLAEVYEQLENTPKRLKKTYIIAKLLRNSKDDLIDIVYLLQGRVFAAGDKNEIGVSSKIITKSIANYSGLSTSKIENMLSKEGDLGIVAEKLLNKGGQQALFKKKLTVNKVVENIRKLVDMTGSGAVNKKLALVSELLNMAEPLEAKYIARTILENLRTGVGGSTLRDALVWAFLPKIIGIFHYCPKCQEFTLEDKCLECNEKIKLKFKEEIEQDFKGLKKFHADSVEELKGLAKFVDIIIPESEKSARQLYNYIIEIIQNAYDMTTDYGLIAEKLRDDGLESLKGISLEPGKAIKVMLYTKAKDFEDAFSIVGKPALAERKFDGFRMQIHGKGKDIKLYTRNLDNVTNQFPDVVEQIQKNVKANSFIIDTEIVGINPKTKKFMPFQNISQRIKRKYEIEKLIKELPIIIEIFDVMEINGKNLIKETFEKRRQELKKVVKEVKDKIVLVEQKIVSTVKDLEKFYNEVLEEGVEGVMLKNIEGIYKPGSRVGYGVKLKPTRENLDLVIVAAEWGEGKRAKWLSSFTLACRDENKLKTIGKVGTGIKEKNEGLTFEELTKELKPLIIEQIGKSVKVKPKIIVEVGYQEIQKSPSYSSGYALRFPRVIRLRNMEKGLEDINTIKDVENLYHQQ
ncbi:MAG: ATP-dependent DNA ligase [Nanoarchaeota archaeon]|nr:ATP-dependent DNA ligase [Nanoarchaeota archaeon]MBU4241808.1 ATP-dependent DNA ligase [Nanoarchaeota archaeon]MBU4352704.1 ATP-dependent DNA ligase [Nanoarchaeota archaeon]